MVLDSGSWNLNVLLPLCDATLFVFCGVMNRVPYVWEVGTVNPNPIQQ